MIGNFLIDCQWRWLLGTAAILGGALVAGSPTPAHAAISVPACQSTAAPAQAVLSGVTTASTRVSGTPFGVVFSPNGGVAFVGLQNSLGVLSTASFPPRQTGTISLPRTASGLAMTSDGAYVIVAAYTGAIVVDAAKAAAGQAGAVLGSLVGAAGTSAVNVTLSADDRYAFVSQEYGNGQTGNLGNVEVFDLQKALASDFTTSGYLGHLALGKAVVGSALSPDGTTLYATSQLAADGSGGLLSVIDVATLTTTPSSALIRNVRAGCNPVRVAVAPGGATVWVTARGSNALLAFDSAKLTADPTKALLTWVRVGTAPVGLIFTLDGSHVLTADSNRFNATGATTGLTVVDAKAAVAGKAANVGRIPTGAFPREFAIDSAGGAILVSNFDSSEVQAVSVGTLPSASALTATSWNQDSSCAATETGKQGADASLQTKWCSLGTKKWMYYGFGAIRTVTEIRVKHAGAGGEWTSWNTKDYDLYLWNGSTWVAVAQVRGNSASETVHPITATTGSYLYIGVLTPEQGTGGAARIYELEAYGH